MAFQDKKFSERVSKKFSVAQKVTEKYLRDNNIPFVKYGFDDHGMTYEEWMKVPAMIRNTPDLIAVPGEFTFLEVKGCQGPVKIKWCDYLEYKKWEYLNKFSFSIYSTTEKKLHMVTMSQLEEAMIGATTGKYPDNKKDYFAIPLKKIQKYMVPIYV